MYQVRSFGLVFKFISPGSASLWHLSVFRDPTGWQDIQRALLAFLSDTHTCLAARLYENHCPQGGMLARIQGTNTKTESKQFINYRDCNFQVPLLLRWRHGWNVVWFQDCDWSWWRKLGLGSGFHIQNSFTRFSSREENEGQDKTDAGDKQLCTHGLSRGLGGSGGGGGWRCR